MFEPKPDPQLEALKTQLAEMISLQRALLTKIESQHVKLVALADFVGKNSSSTAAFGTARTR